MWAEGEDIPEVGEELWEELQKWVELRFARNLEIPKVGDIDHGQRTRQVHIMIPHGPTDNRGEIRGFHRGYCMG